jgi:hypothetical protein
VPELDVAELVLDPAEHVVAAHHLGHAPDPSATVVLVELEQDSMR